MAHAVVQQLRFARSEWLRGLRGVTEQDGAVHCGQMNSIGWIVGHLTWQEQRYGLYRPQGIMLLPDVQERFAFGAPMSTPSLAQVLKAWRKVTRATEPFLESLTTKDLQRDLPLNGRHSGQSLGSAIRRLTYHY
jgi:DinB family protein